MKNFSIQRVIGNRLVWLPFFLLFVGCAVTQTPTNFEDKPALAPVHDSDDLGWRSVRFQMDQPDRKPCWETDLLLAHKIVSPVLDAFLPEIRLWRFHRRAGNDNTGHQFSFIFYTTAAVTGQINEKIAANPLLKQLLHSGTIKAYFAAKTIPNERPEVGDTSDPKWSPVMENNWPYYIMGVCRMWLGMVDQVSCEIGQTEKFNQDRLLSHYRDVNQKVTHIWQQEGYHALLHHLNAIYGYEAMVYWEKRWKSF
jgi:hypothetical protein